MTDVLDTVDNLVTRATTLRKREDYGKALSELDEAIQLLGGALTSNISMDAGAQRARRRIAEKLSDCHGMQGGINRREGKLQEAELAYAKGREIEQDPQFAISNTYCLVNELVMKLLQRPNNLASMQQKLEEAREIAWSQARGPRRKQWWAWADAGLLSLLTGGGTQASMDEALDAYTEFARTSARPSDYESTIGALEELQIRLAKDEPKLAFSLSRTIEHLRRHLRSAVPEPVCFVAMPYGEKEGIDFDRLYNEAIRPAIQDVGLTAMRADEDPEAGGLIHAKMLSRLQLSEFVVADLSTKNANVFYELGVRHGAGRRSTILLWGSDGEPPIDVAPYLQVRYATTETDGIQKLREDLTQRLRQAREAARTAPNWSDNPLVQLFIEDSEGSKRLAHAKADLFRDLVTYDENVKRELADARSLEDLDEAFEQIRNVQMRYTDLATVEPGILVDLMLSYRHVKKWDAMIRLVELMPLDLRTSIFVREQTAFALNRRNQGHDRQETLAILETLNDQRESSETLSLTGRVYKDLWDQARTKNATKALGYLRKAIDTYERGFLADPRDAYPGINAATLNHVLDTAKSRKRRDELLVVVRFAIESRLRDAPTYWDYATLVEAATLQTRYDDAEDQLANALACDHEQFAIGTTARNLELIASVATKNGEDASRIHNLITRLRQQ